MIHLYKHQSVSEQVNAIVKSFVDVKSIDIANFDAIEKSDIYFVEIDKVEKEFLLLIKKLLINKKESLIYFYINDSHSLMLFQLSSFLNVKNIFTKKNDLTAIVAKINADLLKHKGIKQNHQLIDHLTNQHYFMLFESSKLLMASQKIYNDFACKTLEEISSVLCSKLELEIFLSKDMVLDKELILAGEKKHLKVSSVRSEENNQTILYLQKGKEVHSEDNSKMSFIKIRIFFIEMLKERILEQDIVKSELGIITVAIENMSALRDDWADYDIEMAIKDLLLQVEIEIDSHTLIAQYSNNLYISLFEGLEFEDLKQEAIKINTYLSQHIKKQKIKPIISLHVLDVKDLELNNILNVVSDISKNNVSTKELAENKLFRVLGMNEELDDGTVINQLLQSLYVNKTDVKLQNIYKGLCINTASKILKKTEDTLYVSFEKLQGTAMSFEKQTLIQSSSFSKDITATVKHIDFNKNIVQLKEFKFIQGNANSRQYSRVTCSQRTPIAVKHDKGVLNGVILDISLNSIAIRTRIHNDLSSLKLSKIILSFTLPVKSNEEGYMKLDFDAKVVFSVCDDEYCKVVVNLLENQENEAVLMEYVYGRQKDIIIELKKQTNIIG